MVKVIAAEECPSARCTVTTSQPAIRDEIEERVQKLLNQFGVSAKRGE